MKIKRNGKLIDLGDPHSTRIRAEQVEKLKRLATVTIRRVKNDRSIRLQSKTSTPIYSTGKLIKCDGCQKISPTKRMHQYSRSSRGAIILCERCDESAERRTFFKLDALDHPRKQYKMK